MEDQGSGLTHLGGKPHDPKFNAACLGFFLSRFTALSKPVYEYVSLFKKDIDPETVSFGRRAILVKMVAQKPVHVHCWKEGKGEGLPLRDAL